MANKTGKKWAAIGATGLFLSLIFVLAGCSQDLDDQDKGSDEATHDSLGAEYVGSDACFDCHPAIHNDFVTSGNPWKLKTSDVARNNPIPVPAGYAWDLISYVIGGNTWKTLYVDNNGYLITSAGGRPGNNQYNLLTGTWSNYKPDELVSFTCGECHTTGYSPEGNQGGLPGIVGTWELEGVQCEACHGPAGNHVEGNGEKKETIVIDDSAALCGRCHTSGENLNVIPAANGYILKNGQYNEHQASPHQYTDCANCHDPHKKGEFSVKIDCGDCHLKVRDDFTGSTMDVVGVDCQDCHMPRATLSGQSLGLYQGDVRTHLFRINTDPDASMFTDDGKFAKDYVTLDFACLSCHLNRDLDWAAANAEGIHPAGK
jgi:hypothetical protein